MVIIHMLFLFILLLSHSLQGVIVTFDVLEHESNGHTIALLGDYHLFSSSVVESSVNDLRKKNFDQFKTITDIIHERSAAGQSYHILIEDPSNLGKKNDRSIQTSLKDYIDEAARLLKEGLDNKRFNLSYITIENVDIRATDMAFYNLLLYSPQAIRLSCKPRSLRKQDNYEDRTQDFPENGQYQVRDKIMNLWRITFRDLKTEFEEIKKHFRDLLPTIESEMFQDLTRTSLQHAEREWQALEHLWIEQARLSYDAPLCSATNRIHAGEAFPLYYPPSSIRAFCERTSLVKLMPSLEWYVPAPLVERTITAQEFRACLRESLRQVFNGLYRLHIMERILALGSQRKILVIAGCYHTAILKTLLKYYGYTLKVSHGSYPKDETLPSSKLPLPVMVDENLFKIL